MAALLVTAKSAPVMRKMLFNSRHFFLGRGNKDTVNRLLTTVVVLGFTSEDVTG